MLKKKELFVNFLFAGNTQLQAAILAGYAPKSAHVAANRLLKDDNVKALIEAKRFELQRKAKEEEEANWLSTENVAKGFKNIHDRCMQATPVMRWDGRLRQMVQVTDDEGRAVWQFDSNGANRAWENIAKHVGFYELDNSQKNPIINVQLAQQNNYYGNGEQATGNNGELTDPSLFTLLPPSTD